MSDDILDSAKGREGRFHADHGEAERGTACYTQPVFEVISKTGPGALTCNIVLPRVWSTDCLFSGIVFSDLKIVELFEIRK